MGVFLRSIIVSITMLLSANLYADTTIYGKIHVSADVVDIGASDGNGISSNASRIGFKGKKDLDNGFKAIWKIETELDMSDELTLFKGRNRYLGLNYGKSTLIVGNHDTPFKTLGAKVSVMPNTIADRRGILGRNSLTDTEFDVRAKSSVMLINRSVNAIEIRLLRSAGKVNAGVGDKTPITSASILYKTPHFILGGAYEKQAVNGTSGSRFITGFELGVTRLHLIYERLNASTNSEGEGWDRSAMGFSFEYKITTTSIKAHAFFAQDLENQPQSGGQLLAMGVYHQLAKSFEVYAIIAKIKNETFASYTVAGSGHGDRYRPSSAGVSMNAVSLGWVYKF